MEDARGGWQKPLTFGLVCIGYPSFASSSHPHRLELLLSASITPWLISQGVLPELSPHASTLLSVCKQVKLSVSAASFVGSDAFDSPGL